MAHILGLAHVHVLTLQARDSHWQPGKSGRRRDPLIHLINATSHADGLRVWLEPFRGVATRYLGNYLAWYRRVEPFVSGSLERRLIGGICADSYQQPARTVQHASETLLRPP
jgi:hypothetical protein